MYEALSLDKNKLNTKNYSNTIYWRLIYIFINFQCKILAVNTVNMCQFLIKQKEVKFLLFLTMFTITEINKFYFSATETKICILIEIIKKNACYHIFNLLWTNYNKFGKMLFNRLDIWCFIKNKHASNFVKIKEIISKFTNYNFWTFLKYIKLFIFLLLISYRNRQIWYLLN